MGTVYLLHFEHPIGNPENPRAQAQHYIGYADDFKGRIYHHKRNTSGVKIINGFAAQGLKFEVARKWTGDRSFERRLKNRKNAPRLCPICCKAKGIKPQPVEYQEWQQS